MEILAKDNITLKAEAKNWEEAVMISGKTLVKNGVVEQRYIKAMVDTVKQLGPYIVIAPGIAIAHARPEDGVITCGFAVTTLKKPVKFGNESNDPVDLIITIAAIDHDGHLDALADLMSVIGDENKYKKIVSSDSVEDVYRLLKA